MSPYECSINTQLVVIYIPCIPPLSLHASRIVVVCYCPHPRFPWHTVRQIDGGRGGMQDTMDKWRGNCKSVCLPSYSSFHLHLRIIYICICPAIYYTHTLLNRPRGKCSFYLPCPWQRKGAPKIKDVMTNTMGRKGMAIETWREKLDVP